jgi:hypothetical protein
MAGRLIPTVSSAETWRQVYDAFQNINFTSYDYNTIKQSLIDYIRTYFPESFNDFIESSELIAIVETFAYVGELVAYRQDLNARENFLPVAQRKQSVLRLAKFISYTAARNIPARGLVKITSIRTSERLTDSKGVNLTNKNIVWNDPTNPDWKEQFILVLNRALQNDFGTVTPSERVQVQDILFELYTFDNQSLPNGIIRYSVSVSDQTYTFELVPAALNSDGPYERRPENSSAMTLLYASDGLGDGSNSTGFMFVTKQGSLQKLTETFDGVTPNQTFQINSQNINETDIWLNNINTITGSIVDDGSSSTGRSGAWVQVDTANSQNIIFNTNTARNKYEVETLENDDVRLIFGDGEFANVPSGTFDIWFRISANNDVIVPQSSIQGTNGSLTYQDVAGNNQTLSFKFSLISTIQNASPSEDIEHIRRTARAVYYTQDRMVNGRDYNTFMLQDPTILKLQAINRTFAGESKWMNFTDPSEAYDNVKLFGNDLALYYGTNEFVLPDVGAEVLGTAILDNYLEPILSNPNFYMARVLRGDTNPGRRLFTTAERNEIPYALGDVTPTHPIPLPSVGFPVYLVHDTATDTWIAYNQDDYTNVWLVLHPDQPYFIKIVNANPTVTPWSISYSTSTLTADSQTTRFWFAQDGDVVDFDSQTPSNDVVTVLNANSDNDRARTLVDNIDLVVLGHDEYLNSGLPDIHRLDVVPTDSNRDGLPDNIRLSELLNPSIDITDSTSLSAFYVVNFGNTASYDGTTGLLAPTNGTSLWNVGSNKLPDTPTDVANNQVAYRLLLEVDLSSTEDNSPINSLNQPLQRFYVDNDITPYISKYRLFSVTGSTGTIYTIVAVITGAGGTWTISGNSALLLSNFIGHPFTVTGNTGTGNGTYTIASATDVGPNTNIVVNETIPIGATADGSLVVDNNGVYTIDSFRFVQGTSGTQIVNVGGSRVSSDITGLTNDVGATQGSQTITFSVAKTGSDPTALVPTTTYVATVTVDGAVIIPISIIGSTATTFSTLLSQLSSQLGGFATVQQLNGNIVITSDTFGATSNVAVSAGTLFVAPLASVNAPGSWITIPGTDTITTPYYATITIDTVNIIPVSVAGGIAQIYGGLLDSLNSQIGAFGTASIVNGNIQISSNSVGTSSTVSIVDAGTSGYQEVDFTVAKTLLDSTGLIATAGYQEVSVFGLPLGTVVPAIPADTYDFDITIDGGPLQQESIVLTGVEDYNTIAALMDAEVTPAATVTFVGGEFVFTSTTLGTTSSILVAAGTFGSTGGDIFAAIAVAAGGANTFNAAVPGTDTTYTATINIDGTNYPISVDATNAQTYTQLLAELNTDLAGAATALLIAGNIRVTSASIGQSSTVLITPGTLFADPDLTDFDAILTAVPGLNSLFSLLATFNSFGTPVVGTNAIGTEIITFELIPSAVADGQINYRRAAITRQITFTGDQIQTYGSLVDVINQGFGDIAKAELVGGNIQLKSLTTGDRSKVNVINIDTIDSIITAIAAALLTVPNVIYSGDIEGDDFEVNMSVVIEDTYVITAVTTGLGGTFVVPNDRTSAFTPGSTFDVTGSTGNDGTYTVASSVFGLGNTTITITGTVVSAIVDGIIERSASLPSVFRMSQGLTWTQFINTVIADLPVFPQVNITIVGGNLKFETLLASDTSTLTVTFGAPVNWDVNYLGHILANDVTQIGSGSSVTLATPLIVPIPLVYIEGRGDVTIIGNGTLLFVSGIHFNVSHVLNQMYDTVEITDLQDSDELTIIVNDYVYFYQDDPNVQPVPIEPTDDNIQAFINDTSSTNTNTGSNYSRQLGRSGLNFMWRHHTRLKNLIDPAATNIIDMFIIQRDYYLNIKDWLAGEIVIKPAAPTPYDLRSSYAYLLDNRMLSDTVVLQSGQFKYLFGPYADQQLQATFKVIRSQFSSLTDNQIKATIQTTVNNYFDISQWEFGETFFFTELAAAIHTALPSEIDSVVLVPTYPSNTFGDLFQVPAEDNEIFLPHIPVSIIQIVQALDRVTIRQA